MANSRFVRSPAARSCPGSPVLDAVSQATVECGQTAGYYYVGKNMAFAFETTLPFGLDARQQIAWMYAGGGRELMRELYTSHGVVMFPGGNTGVQMGGWFRKEIKSLADLKGLKMRILGIGGQIMARLGVVPQTLAGGDIYRRSKAARSTPPNGSGRTTTRNSVSTKSPNTTTTPAGGSRVRRFRFT